MYFLQGLAILMINIAVSDQHVVKTLGRNFDESFKAMQNFKFIENDFLSELISFIYLMEFYFKLKLKDMATTFGFD